MSAIRASLFSIVLILLSFSSFAASPFQNPKTLSPDKVIVAISDFKGDDKSLSKTSTELLLSAVSSSGKCQTVSRADLRLAYSDLGLPLDKPLNSSQYSKLSIHTHADLLITGSYLQQDGQLLMIARIIDLRTGKSLAGGAVSASGEKNSLDVIIGKLADLIIPKVAGEEADTNGSYRQLDRNSQADNTGEINFDRQAFRTEPTYRNRDTSEFVSFASLQRSGVIPTEARPEDRLSEYDLAGLVKRVTKHFSTPFSSPINVNQPATSVNRLRLVTALVKLYFSVAKSSQMHDISRNRLTLDAESIPMWGRPFVGAAIDQGWISAENNLRPRNAADWGFVHEILSRMDTASSRSGDSERNVSTKNGHGGKVGFFTGLVIDSRKFDLKRDHSPRILDEDGTTVYPDGKHIPDYDYIDAQGMAAYYTVAAEVKRSGENPLVVHALNVSGPGPFDVVVSHKTAEQIREANRKNHFLWSWKVSFLQTLPPEAFKN